MAQKLHIDFNIDVAQGFGVFHNESEIPALDYVSSVNVSCGLHAGDPLLMRNILLKCKDKNISIGAHIGFNDVNGMGYRPIALKPEEIEAIVIYQIGAIKTLAKSYGLEIEHVRPHGAMYIIASQNYDFSLAIANAILKCDKWLAYTCLDNAVATKVHEETGIVINREMLLDKPYSLEFGVDFNSKNTVSEEEALNRIRTLMFSSQIKVGNGNFLPLNADTIHFDCKNKNIINLLQKSNDIVKPTPVNYNKAELSGWV